MNIKHSAPVLGFVAYSGTGKTTLLEQLIPHLNAQGVRVAMLKHAHHQFDIDQEGKDSYRLRKAGAHQMLIASDQRWALMTETPREDSHAPPRFKDLIEKLDHQSVDLILVEGFKAEVFSKIELHRASCGHGLICLDDPNIIAVAADSDLSDQLPSNLPQLDINHIPSVAEFVLEFIGQHHE